MKIILFTIRLSLYTVNSLYADNYNKMSDTRFSQQFYLLGNNVVYYAESEHFRGTCGIHLMCFAEQAKQETSMEQSASLRKMEVTCSSKMFDFLWIILYPKI
jgi:hypothetical protein